MAAVVCCWSIVTTAEGTLNHWATNRQQLNRIFPARPFLPFGNNDFPLNSDYDVSYDGRHLEMPSTEMMSVNPESRASGRFSRPNNFLSSGIHLKKIITIKSNKFLNYFYKIMIRRF
jgi:hypothetical protein